MVNFRPLMIGMMILVASALAACSTYKETGSEDFHDRLESDADSTVNRFRRTDSSLGDFFNNAAGYAVFPKVTKGAAGIGAAHGHGVLYESGRLVGYTELTQATLGLQLGGQTYSELIFFQTAHELDLFKRGETKFSAQASAVAAAQGNAANADYAEGVAIFTLGESGLMFEASVGGQKFSFREK